MTQSEIVAYCKRELLCDSARFTYLGEKIFLVVGWRKATEQGNGQWYRNGEPWDFDYLEEHCIAVGHTLDEVMRHARYFNMLEGVDREEAWRILLTAEGPGEK